MRRGLDKLRAWLYAKVSKAWSSTKPGRRLHEPQVLCPTAFCGGGAYGGWTLCPDGLSPRSLMYSFGVGEDASFDLQAISRYGLQVYAFDPTPRSIEWVRRQDWPAEFNFYPIGVAARNGTITFRPPENPDHVSHTILERPGTDDPAIQVEMKRLGTIADMLGHEHIDILKMDIEGAEYEVVQDIAQTAGLDFGQILIEFHHFFPNVSIEHTCSAVDTLNACGYEIFHVSSNGKEYSFIRP